MNRINNFDVLKEMGLRNLDIRCAPLDNITNMRKVKAGTQITIGFAGDVINSILTGELIGMFILADKRQFNDLKSELVDGSVQSPENRQERNTGTQGVQK